MPEEKNAPKKKSFSLDYSLSCPMCMEEEVVFVNTGAPDNFTCSACSEDFNLDLVREKIGGWIRYIADYDAQS